MDKSTIKKSLAEIDAKLVDMIDNLDFGEFASDIEYSDMNNALAKALNGVRDAIWTVDGQQD